MVEDHSYMFITGPDVVRAVTMEEVTDEDLGGASIHATRSGVAHFAIESEEACLNEVRRLVSFLPLNNLDDPPIVEMGDDPRRRDEDLLTVLPENDIAALRRARGHLPRRRQRRLPRSARRLRPEHRRRPGAPGRPHGRHRRQPAAVPGRHAGHRRVDQGGALRALLRLLQHPDRHASSTSPATCRARRRSTAASSPTAPSWCTPTPRPRCRR